MKLRRPDKAKARLEARRRRHRVPSGYPAGAYKAPGSLNPKKGA